MSSARSKSSKARAKPTARIIVKRGTEECEFTFPFTLTNNDDAKELTALSNCVNDATDLFIQIRDQMDSQSKKGEFDHHFNIDMVKMRTICRVKTEEEEGSMVIILNRLLSSLYTVKTIGFPFDESGTSISTEGKKMNGNMLVVVVRHK
jgi:hypothetical protein